MERLTYDDCYEELCNEPKFSIAIRKLNQYEDLGDYDRLRELVQADKDGRVIIKPKPLFSVGDTVRIRDAMDNNWIGRTGKVTSVSNYLNCPISYRLNIGGGDWLQSMLTRAEAEAALKEAENERTN